MRKVSRGLLGYAVMIAAFIFLIAVLSNGMNIVNLRIEYPDLLQKIEKGEVDRVSIRGTSLVGRNKTSTVSLGIGKAYKESRMVAVAAGERKAEAIIAATRHEKHDSLITDEAAAQKIVALMK